jgi:hypothetical protein
MWPARLREQPLGFMQPLLGSPFERDEGLQIYVLTCFKKPRIELSPDTAAAVSLSALPTRRCSPYPTDIGLVRHPRDVIVSSQTCLACRPPFYRVYDRTYLFANSRQLECAP